MIFTPLGFFYLDVKYYTTFQALRMLKAPKEKDFEWHAVRLVIIL